MRHAYGMRGASLIALVVAAPLRAQDVLRTPPLVQLGKEHYKSIADVRERASGEVLVADPEDASLWSVSSSGNRKNAATSGSPGAPGRMISFGDGILFFNRMGSGFKVLKADGTVADASPQFAPPEGPMRFGSTTDSYFADNRAQLYWLDGQLDPRGAPLRRRDAANQTSVVATLKNPPSTTVRQGAIGFIKSLPFSLVDDWAVDDSGTIAIARAEPYHIEIISRGGAVATGAPHALAAVPTMEEDKQILARSRQKALSTINLNGVSIGNAGGDDSLPPTKAPFARGGTRIAHNGMVWVHRAVAATSQVALVDVFGADGNYRETFSLPKGARVVGFGARRVYLAIPANSNGALTLHAFDQ